MPMPISEKHICGSVRVAVWKITETAKQLAAMLGDSAYVREALAMGSEQRAAERLAVRLLMKNMLGCEAAMEYDVNGKPHLTGVDGYISVSHTRGYASLAFSEDYPVGLDVELKSREVGAVSRYFMNDDELLVVPQHLRNIAKLIRWTACEAVFKIVGNCGGTYKENIVLDYSTAMQGGLMPLELINLPSVTETKYEVVALLDRDLLITLCRPAGCDSGETFTKVF